MQDKKLKQFTCKECGKEFETNASYAYYCSKRCQRKVGDRARKPRTYVCQKCGKEFQSLYRNPKYPRKYCSHRCHRWLGRIHKRGFRVNRDYILLNVNSLPENEQLLYADKKAGYPYVAEHIYVVEKAIGRRLKKGEVVHHINGKKSDNRHCNLLLCDDSYHKWLHQRMSELYQQEHFGHL